MVITYQQLLEALAKLTPAQLDKRIVVENDAKACFQNTEFRLAKDHLFFDDGHPIIRF